MSGNAQPDENTAMGGTGNSDGREVANHGYGTDLGDVEKPEDIDYAWDVIANTRPEYLEARIENPVRSWDNVGSSVALVDRSHSRPDASGNRQYHQGGLELVNTSGSGSTKRFVAQVGPMSFTKNETDKDLLATFLHVRATKPKGTTSTAISWSHNTNAHGSKAIRMELVEEGAANGSAKKSGQSGFAKGKSQSKSRAASTGHSAQTGIAKGDSRGKSRGRSRTSKPRKERTTRSRGRVGFDEDIQEEDDLETSEAQGSWDKRPKSGRGSKTYDPSRFQLNRELPVSMSRNWVPDAEAGSSVRRPWQWTTERNRLTAKVDALMSKSVLTPEEEKTLMEYFKKLRDLEKEPVHPRDNGDPRFVKQVRREEKETGTRQSPDAADYSHLSQYPQSRNTAKKASSRNADAEFEDEFMEDVETTG